MIAQTIALDKTAGVVSTKRSFSVLQKEYNAMGFNDDKKKMIEALRKGVVLHESRSYQEDKNMLATGQITEEEAALILGSVPGRDAEASFHHYDRSQSIWIMKTNVEGIRWHLKAYLQGENVVFLSFHQMNERFE